MSKTVGYENLFTITGSNKRTGSETRLRIIGTDRINGTWKTGNAETLIKSAKRLIRKRMI